MSFGAGPNPAPEAAGARRPQGASVLFEPGPALLTMTKLYRRGAIRSLPISTGALHPHSGPPRCSGRTAAHMAEQPRPLDLLAAGIKLKKEIHGSEGDDEPQAMDT